MSEIDLDRASALLNVIEKAAGHTPKLNSLAVVAMAELADMNEAARVVVAAKAKADEAKRMAEAKAEAAQRAKDEEAAKPKAAPPSQLRAGSDLTLGAPLDRPDQNPNNQRDANVDLTDRRV